MSALREYRETIRYLYRKEVSQERAELFKILNGDAFFPLQTWPHEMKMVFWQKSIGDKDTPKLAPFLLGNGCSDLVHSTWSPSRSFCHKVTTNSCISIPNGLPKRWGEPATYSVKKKNKQNKNHKRTKTLLYRGTKKAPLGANALWPIGANDQCLIFCFSLKNYAVLIEPYCNTNTP